MSAERRGPHGGIVPEPPPQPSPVGYPVLCAWCEAKGVRTVLRYEATCEGSHGICPPCAATELTRFRRERGEVAR